VPAPKDDSLERVFAFIDFQAFLDYIKPSFIPLKEVRMTDKDNIFLVRRFEGDVIDLLRERVAEDDLIRARIDYVQKASVFFMALSFSMMLAASYSTLPAIGIEVPMMIVSLISFGIAEFYGNRRARLHPVVAQRAMLILIDYWDDCYEELARLAKSKIKPKPLSDELLRASLLRKRIDNVMIISGLRDGGVEESSFIRLLPEIEELIADTVWYTKWLEAFLQDYLSD
jgi:hypothetical protein